MALTTYLAILAAVAIGLAAYMRLGSRGGTIRDGLAVVRSGFLVVVGIGLIVSGFVIAGAILVALFVYLGVGAGSNVRDDLRGRLNP